MADEFGVIPDQLRGVSNHVDDVRGRVIDVMSSLRANLDAVGAAWGCDPIGDGYRNSPNGHEVQVCGHQEKAEAIADVLDGCSNNLRHAANSFEQYDQVQQPGRVAMVRHLPDGFADGY